MVVASPIGIMLKAVKMQHIDKVPVKARQIRINRVPDTPQKESRLNTVIRPQTTNWKIALANKESIRGLFGPR